MRRGRHPNIADIVARARTYHELLETGEAKNKAEIARREGVSRARITQIMNLLNLPEQILNSLVNQEPKTPSAISERDLRCVSNLPTQREQMEAFEALVAYKIMWNSSNL